ncbi:alpha/beta fold hydrolase, partial [Nonomuraea mesophila]
MIQRELPAAGLAAVVLASLVAGSPAAAAAEDRGPEVSWRDCPAYSDDVLRSRRVPDARIPEFRRLLDRLECGTVKVPLDHGKPDGRQITVAITRLKATNRPRRLGSLAVNPGGPGGSGYLMPIDMIMGNASAARLNERYDLVGFDPRGVGYSTKVDCKGPGPGGPGPGPNPSPG